MKRTGKWLGCLSLVSSVAACAGSGYDDAGNEEAIDADGEPVRNGAVVTPFGPNPAPLYTRAIVSHGGCTGTLVDPYWVLSAAHCGFVVGSTATSIRPTGNVTANVDRVVNQAGGDLALLHLSSRIDMPEIALRAGSTSSIIGNAVECYGYGAMDASGFIGCTTNDECPAGQWCQGGNCLTGSADLRTGTLQTSAYDDLFFQTQTNGAGQLTLPGDSGGPCFLNGQLAGVNSWWNFDISGGGQASVPGGSTWINTTLNDAGFVRVTSTSGSGAPSTAYSMNTTGGSNLVTWLATGSARVDFPGLGKSVGGHVQVTAFGTSNARCKVSSWFPSGTTLRAQVNCYTPSGAATSTPFAVSYQRRAGTPGVEGGYVWADQPTASSYTPSTIYQWNSTGALNTIQRTGVGTYRVVFPGQTFTGGTVEVTAYGGGSDYCKVEGWFNDGASQNVNVRCFSTSGAPVDALFTAKFTRGSPTSAKSFGFVWAHQPTTSSYQPDSTYQLVSVGSACGQLTRGPVSITRSSTGRYNVTFTGLPGSSSFRSHVKVTAYGTGSETCKVRSWTPSSNSSAEVACYNANGTAADTLFTVSYSSTAGSAC
jgi:hypothetical protein